MNYDMLADLLQQHPQWPTATDAELTAWVNEAAVTQTLPRLNTEAMYEAIDAAEFSAISAERQAEVWNILLLHATTGVPTAAGTRARNRLIAIFGAGSATINNLVAAISVLVSRATAASIGADTVTEGDVAFARSQVPA